MHSCNPSLQGRFFHKWPHSILRWTETLCSPVNMDIGQTIISLSHWKVQFIKVMQRYLTHRGYSALRNFSLIWNVISRLHEIMHHMIKTFAPQLTFVWMCPYITLKCKLCWNVVTTSLHTCGHRSSLLQREVKLSMWTVNFSAVCCVS